MMHRSGFLVWGAGALTGVLTVWTSLMGCQGDAPGTTSSSSQSSQGTGGAGTGGATGSAGETGGGGTDTGTGMSTSTGQPTGGSTSSGGSMGTAVTIKDVTTGVVGPGVKVKLTGVVAMSQKFLVSKGSSGSCLWGVFVSDPGLKETAPNTGSMVLSYGTNASVPQGGTTAFCPKLGIDPIGDKIPDDTKPGDVLDVSGETAYFLLSQCATQMGGSTVAQYQIAKSTVTKTGTAPVPAAHVMTAAELDQLASPSDKDFHNKWGGVKVKITDVAYTPQMVKDPKTGNMVPSVIDGFGNIVTQAGGLKVGDHLYYRGYSKDKNFCYNGPSYSAPFPEKFTSIEGFSYLDFCSWSIQPNDKCADIAPASTDPKDCNGSATACAK